MTEGIIQKIFSKYHKHYFRVNYTNIDYESLMRAIEQELIAEIAEIQKKRVWQWNAVSLKDLIGDNE